MKKLIILSIFFLISTYSYSQIAKIKGKVICTNTGKTPSDRAYILIKSPFEMVIADSVGNYTFSNLELGKIYDIELQGFFGYDGVIKRVKLEDSVTIVNFEVEIECEYNKQKALIDIENDEIKFLLSGGIVPKGNTKIDNRFEKKFKLDYYDFGCNYVPYECLEEYNQTISDYLDKTYGNKWREKIRKDVVFLN
jgi:hypothetical protein